MFIIDIFVSLVVLILGKVFLIIKYFEGLRLMFWYFWFKILIVNK